jgi:predicted regulator of Ras-like GTPase activity (Roadblock/LC7/MglB family)
LPEQYLTIDQSSYEQIAGLCAEFVERSDATCALLVGQDGCLIYKHGFVEDLDLQSLAALAAATFASTGEMARMIGEAQFDFFMQQGAQRHIQLIRVGDAAILLAVFDDRTTAGMVRLRAQQTTQRLTGVLCSEA